MRNIILVFTIGEDLSYEESTDHYELFDSLDDAKARYNEVLQLPDLLIASITGVIESTDYETYNFNSLQS